MSTIASPRPSFASLITPNSSRRPSLDTVNRSQVTSPARAPQKRNRAALRDYYGLKGAAPPNAEEILEDPTASGTRHRELDAEGFDAEKYVRDLLAREGLERILRVEAELINEIKGLDGERKALVYDNYSKLITATDTIRKMRTNMDPLTPATSTLSPAISHIAETAAILTASLQYRSPGNNPLSERSRESTSNTRQEQQNTVRWVVATPRRLRRLLDAGQVDEANADWSQVQGLLRKWPGVKGVEQIEEECTTIIGRG